MKRLTIHQLKAKAKRLWELLNKTERSIPGRSLNDDVRAMFGDLRRRDTWANAFAHFYAQITHNQCLDAWALITDGLNFGPHSEYQEFGDLIIDKFLAMPNGLSLLKMGLEQLLDIRLTQTWNEDVKDGILWLVERTSRAGGGATLPAANRPQLIGADC